MAEPEFAPRQSGSRACIVKHTARHCSSQTDQSPFCLYIEATDVLICHLGPVAGKRNHSSILVCCRISGRAERRGPSEIIPSMRLPIRPSRGGLPQPHLSFRWHSSLQFKGQEIAVLKMPLNTHQTCLLTAVRFGMLEHCRKTQCFHKCACQH